MSKRNFRSLEPPGDPVAGWSEPLASLQEWYLRVRDIPIEDFEIRDLCIACRQHEYPDQVVPVALARLRTDPLAGELYDGELASCVARLPKSFWAAHTELYLLARSVLAVNIDRMDDDVAAEVRVLLGNQP